MRHRVIALMAMHMDHWTMGLRGDRLTCRLCFDRLNNCRFANIRISVRRASGPPSLLLVVPRTGAKQRECARVAVARGCRGTVIGVYSRPGLRLCVTFWGKVTPFTPL